MHICNLSTVLVRKEVDRRFMWAQGSVRLAYTTVDNKGTLSQTMQKGRTNTLGCSVTSTGTHVLIYMCTWSHTHTVHINKTRSPAHRRQAIWIVLSITKAETKRVKYTWSRSGIFCSEKYQTAQFTMALNYWVEGSRNKHFLSLRSIAVLRNLIDSHVLLLLMSEQAMNHPHVQHLHL